jgi:DNA-binding SARP family transcriptional activator/catechol 2,3-dioxygenase-like lactoylglutathione lyase family enzyme
VGGGLYLSVLGPVRAWRDGTPLALGRVGQRAVLGLLALAGERPVTRAELVDALWPAEPPPSAANVIHTHVRRLRQVLEPDRPARGASAVLPAVGDGYALRLPGDGVDVARFRRLVTAAAEGDAATVLGPAIELWQGPPLADVPVLAGHPAVVMLLRERQVARTRYAESMIAAGAAVEALPALERWVAESPLDEAAHALLIRALHRSGQRWQAFDVYRSVRRRLVDDLGVEPGPELAAAHTAALDADSQAPLVPPDRFREFGDRAGAVGSASPFFIVDELPRAVEFYRDRLGFEVTLTAPDPEAFFAVVRRNDAQFLLKVVGVGPRPNRSRHPYARWDAFVYVPDPDGLAVEFGGRGVEFSAPLADTDDGLRGFEVVDADGYLLFFGRPR